MSINKTYAVFGLGKYGLAVAKELVKNGVDVIAVDLDENKVNLAINELPFCKCADTTDIEVLKKLGISTVDVVIVAMGSNLEASVMTVMLCKELGVETVIAKCSDEMHYKILTKVGADQVVFPERESGVRLAKNILSSGFVDVVELTKDVSMVEMDVKDEWIGKNLLELNFRKKYSMNVIAIKQNEKITINIDPTIPLTKDMELVVIGNTSKLSKIK